MGPAPSALRLARPLPGAFVVALLGVLTGCPKDPAQQSRPEHATPCTTDADCNPGGPLCGRIKACVDLRCEATPTRTVHCP